MTTNTDGVDSPNVDDKNQEAADAAQKAEQELSSKSLEDQLAALKAINADAIKTRDAAKRKLREIEVANEKTVAEASGYKERLIKRAVTESLKAALVDAGALSVDTALKLIDKNAIKLNDEFEADPESIKAIVEALTVSDGILFKAKDTPKDEKQKDEKTLPANSVKRPADKSDIKDAYTIAISKCKTMNEIYEVRKQFGFE